MGMNLNVYVGPYVLLSPCPYLEKNDVSDLCEYRLGEKMWCPNDLGDNVLLPNIHELCEKSLTFARDKEGHDPLVNPDIEADKDWFTEKAHDILFKLEALDIPYEVMWGVFSYWM